MGITATVLTGGGSTTDGTSFTTASVTPTGNRLELLHIMAQSSTGNVAPTVTGCGLTWVLVANTTQGTNVRTCLVYRAMGASPTTGALTISDTQTYTQINWTLVEYAGTDTSGTDGSGAIVQTITAQPTGVTTASATLGTTVTAGNSTGGIVGYNTNGTITPGTNYTQLDYESQTTQAQAELTEFAATAQQTVSGTLGASGNAFIVGYELKAAASVTIGESLLTSGNSTTDGTTFTTASVTPAANAQVFVGVMTQSTSSTASNPSVSGCGLTWTQVGQSPPGGFTRTITVWRGTSASPVAGALTITDVTTVGQCAWSVVQLTNCDSSTPVLQTVSGSLSGVTNGSMSFGSQVSTGDATLAWIGYSAAGTLTAGAGWTSIDQQQTTANAETLMTEYAATPQNTVTATLPASGNMFIVGIEAKVVGGAFTSHTFEVGEADPALYFGTTGVTACYFGSTEVWGVNSQTPVPNAPTIGTATAGVTSATVGFTPASSGPVASSYTATSSPGGITGTGTTSPITVSGLTAGTPYTFTVHATNQSGNSTESGASNSVTPTSPPAGTTWGVGGWPQTAANEQAALSLYGPGPLTWRWYDSSSTALAYPNAWTLRSTDTYAYSSSRFYNPAPTVAQMVTLFNASPVGRPFYYCPFHEPEDNIAAGQLSYSQYYALFTNAYAAKQQCSHPSDIYITPILMSYDWQASSGRNPENYLPANQYWDLLGVDIYFGGSIGTDVTTIGSTFTPIVNTAKSHGKPWGVFETGIGQNVSGQTRLNAVQTLSQTIHDDGATVACYYYQSTTDEWYLDSTAVSYWKAGQTL